jgi:hypothetical protein
MRSQRQYIRDILEAMEAAESFVEDVRFEDLEGDLCRVSVEVKRWGLKREEPQRSGKRRDEVQ